MASVLSLCIWPQHPILGLGA